MRGSRQKAGPCDKGCGKVTKHQEGGVYLCKNHRKEPLKKR